LGEILVEEVNNMKVKSFSTIGMDNMESAINKWLETQKNIAIVDIKMHSVQMKSKYPNVLVLIVYREL